MDKIRVGILGATGAVGQRFVQLLAEHPWFEIAALAASERSAGQTFSQACHWTMLGDMPDQVWDMVVQPAEPPLDCELVFSSLPGDLAGSTEARFAKAGYVVCSNASAHRLAPDVPLLIPEVNGDHLALVETQRKQRGWPGLIVTSPNCSATELVLTLKPLYDTFGLRRVSVVTMQAVSGAGYPGVPSLDILDNVIPYIDGEEEKVEHESLKLLGRLGVDRVVDADLRLSAQCNRVAARDGHLGCVSIELTKSATTNQIIAALEAFRGQPQELRLPSAPEQPIIVRQEPDRPQPLRDRGAGDGMVVSVGRVRPCPVLDFKFVVLGHNTVRGAAGGSILNAELLVACGYIKR